MPIPRAIRITRPARACLTAGSLALALAWSSAAAEGPATRIHETIDLSREACTIEILGGDVIVCEGEQATVAAQLQCDEGYLRVYDPQWFLDTTFLGEGDEISFTAPPGEYLLTVTCSSCEDEVFVTVQEEALCYWTPRLDALFSNDETEETTGVFLPVNEGPITPETFPHRKYLMRPFILAADPVLQQGSFVLDADDAILEVYAGDGTGLDLPAAFDVAALPETLLVNATAMGEALVTASYSAGPGARELGVDRVKVRVGAFPGLAGDSLRGYPHFQFVRAVNDDEQLMAALDPLRHAERVGLPLRAYVVAHRSPEQWAADNALIDVSGGYESATVTGGSIAENVLELWSTGLEAGDHVGEPYDVVYDFGLDGRLDPGDLIDGLSAQEAGIYIVRDLNASGPYVTDQIQYSGGSWLGQRTYFPLEIGTMGQLPLVVISHGNGHYYTWYDYLGHHLASYGYVVMAHENNTGPGIESASTTTLTNTDYIIGYQGSIGGGILDGHIDSHRITWIGHSRGGEGVVRAYDRLYDGAYVPQFYTVDDVVLISSIAPTVYLGTVDTHPHEVDYHMLYGAADGDVNGGCYVGHRQSLRIAEAARGNVQVTYVHGAGHNDFNCCGWNDATGPDLIGRAEAQRVAKSYYLALIEHYIRGNVPARDYLTRLYSGFNPSGIAEHVICANTFRHALAVDRFVIDDYQTQTDPGASSSGGAVTYDVSNVHEDRLDDGNLDFTWMSSDPMNGMTRSDDGDIYQGGVVFDWALGENRTYEFEIVPQQRDFRDHAYLSFRACQGTRHPHTVALDHPLAFTVALRDGQGVTSAIGFKVYGTITRPYQRTGLGTGAGWANEFGTVRIRLCDFENDGSGIDLSDIVAVRLSFGLLYGSEQGRIGLDDVELTRD